MYLKLNRFTFLLTVVAVILSSAVGTTAVFADDGSGAGDSQPAAVEVSSGDEATPPESSGGEVSEPAVAESPAVVDETTSAEPSGEEVAAPAADQPSVAEILDQAPEGTDLVVVNEAGEPEPLATQTAVDIVAASDPIWCQEGFNPGSSSGCTSGYTTVTQLIANLGSSSGSGTIYFTSSYSANDVILDGTTSTLAGLQGALNTLTIQGGWNGSGSAAWGLDGNAYNLSAGTTTFSVPVTIQNWTGNIFINDVVIASNVTSVGYGLGVDTTGNIALDNVNVHDTAGSGDGALLSNIAGGNVSITDSQFNNNANGLQVESSGAITLNTVVASGNDLTGAYLNNCLFSNGACQGNDLVTVTSTTTGNQFNGNQTGLIVDAGGGIDIDHVTANSNDVNGAKLTSTDTGGNGNVDVSTSDFSLNAQGTGLTVTADGTIGLTDVIASDNRTGAALNSTDGVGGVTVGTGEFDGNTNSGLHVDSGSTIDLTAVDASDNGNNGAYLVAPGNITVTNSTFNNNVKVSSPADPGLQAESNGGNISLTNVTADGNKYGAGAVLSTSGTGTINVTGGTTGQFNGNGTFGVQAHSGDGNITLSGVVASLNGVKGAYLSSYGLGNIFINNTSSFVENGSYGIYASASKGNINLDQVTVTGNNVTDYGAVLTTSDGGNISVQDSSFTLNTAIGLKIIASGQVDLTNVTADQNGGSGVEVYSTYTASCSCPDSKVVNVAVNVGGGTFTNNGEYGLMVKPGPEGTLVFVAPSSTFGGNGLGDFLLDSSEPAACEKCGCDDENKPPTDSKEPNIVDVPFKGGTPVELNYESFASTILRLPNGNTAEFVYPEFNGFSNLEGVLEEDLPGKLGAGVDFVDGVNISLTDENGNVVTNEDGTITIKFKLPEDGHGTYSILYWDPTLKDGKGGWVQLPLYEAGTIFPLNPDKPEDGRTVLSGVKQVGDTITVTVNFPGIFILTAQ